MYLPLIHYSGFFFSSAGPEVAEFSYQFEFGISARSLFFDNPILKTLLSGSDPFADANVEDSGAGTKEYVHIRVQQQNGRKSLTIVQGLKKEYSYSKILKDLKKEFCNGSVVQDSELGQVIQLQGDQRKTSPHS